jgi:hypothetical protein
MDPHSCKPLVNFSQAFSQLGLVNSAWAKSLAEADAVVRE